MVKSQIDIILRYIVVRLDKRTTNYVLNICEQKTDEIKLVPLVRLLIVLVSKFNGIMLLLSFVLYEVQIGQRQESRS